MQDLNSEDDFRRHVIKVATGLKYHVSYIEAHLSAAGIPDLNIYLLSIDVWVELKIIKHGQVKMRPTQRRWHRDRKEAGGRSWVLVYDRAAQHVLALPGHVAAALAPAEAAWRGAATAEHITKLPSILESLAWSDHEE